VTDPRSAVQRLAGLLLPEQLDVDLFRGAATPEGPGRVFGGQVVAQALAAAAHSVEDGHERPAHSLHAYFLRAGDPARPILYRVLRDFDGGSFANRRVVAMQAGRPILNLAASFHRREKGFGHAAALPDVPPPERCPDLATALAAMGQPMPAPMRELLAAFEMRPVPPGDADAAMPMQYLWFRLAAPLVGDSTLQRIVLAYASDFALLTTSVLPHPTTYFSPKLQSASLDHALWFHADPPVDDWLLYAMDSPWAGDARGFTRGSLFTQDGRLVASVTQEGLIRPKG